MGFVFELLGPIIGGAISQLYQDGKISILKLFLSTWIVLFLCFAGMFFFDGFRFTLRDFLISLNGSFLTALLCAVIAKAWCYLKKKISQRNE